MAYWLPWGPFPNRHPAAQRKAALGQNGWPPTWLAAKLPPTCGHQKNEAMANGRAQKKHSHTLVSGTPALIHPRTLRLDPCPTDDT